MFTTKKSSESYRDQNQPAQNFMGKLPYMMLALFLALGLTACEPEMIKPDPVKPAYNEPTPMGERSMTINMTDAPGDFAELNVEIEKVEVYAESEGWVTLEGEAQIHDITELTNGKEVTIASMAGLGAATYTELRLTYGARSTVAIEVIPGTTIDHDLNIQSETVLPIEADLENQTDANLLIDFNAAASVIETAGEFFLDPVVTFVSDTETGVRGELEAQVNAAIMLMADAENGEISFSTFTDAEGRFLLRGVEEGTYDLVIQFRDGLGELTETTIEGVVIVEGEITNMGSLTLS